MSHSLSESSKMLKRARTLIPGLSQTFSKAPYSYVEGQYPTYLSRGKGSHVYDVDGNEYVDYVLGLGPIILGYCYPRVDNAIKQQLKNGISFSIAHSLELEYTEKLKSIIPGAEMIRFSKTGSDAGTAAIRAARAYTKRENIAYCGGGGVWHDWFTIMTSRNEGIPKILKPMIRKFIYNDLESLKQVFDEYHGDVAAVYLEPMMTEYPQNNFLKKVKKLAHNQGAVLIFDEVVTGFRLSLGGAQEFLKEEADIVVLGKGIANGMPLGAITGKQRYMEKFNEIFYSTTYGGETLSLAAGLAVIDEIKEKSVVEYCWNLGEYMISEFNCISESLDVNIKMEGLPVRSSIVCRDENQNPSLETKSLFYQEAVKRGILFGPGNVFLSFSHSRDDVKKTLKICEDCMKVVKKAITTNSVKKLLKGKIMKPVMTF